MRYNNFKEIGKEVCVMPGPGGHHGGGPGGPYGGGPGGPHGGHRRPPMGGMGHRPPPRRVGCCGCLLPVLGIAAIVAAVLSILL